jgi:hypothetical protein
MNVIPVAVGSWSDVFNATTTELAAPRAQG